MVAASRPLFDPPTQLALIQMPQAVVLAIAFSPAVEQTLLKRSVLQTIW